MGKKTVRGHDIANRFVYSLKEPAFAGSFLQSAGLPVGDLEGVWQIWGREWFQVSETYGLFYSVWWRERYYRFFLQYPFRSEWFLREYWQQSMWSVCFAQALVWQSLPLWWRSLSQQISRSGTQNFRSYMWQQDSESVHGKRYIISE